MTGVRSGGPPLGFDPFSAAVGVAVVVGAIAVVQPYLVAFTGTLAALALASYLLARRVRRSRRSRTASGERWALGAVGIGGVLFLAPPPGYLPFRALGLALALAVLWRVRRAPALEGGSVA